MARRHAGPGEGRHGGECERRLRDVVRRPRLEARAEGLDFLLRGGGADEHAVAAGAVDFLHHEFRQVVEHIGQLLGVAAAPGRHVLQQRLLAGIELDHLGDVGVDRLVIGDAGARRVDQRHAACAVDVEDAGNAEFGVGTEGEGVEIVVVDAAVDHVHPLRRLRGAHVEIAAVDEQVTPLAEFNAHLVGQEGVLEEGRVVDARREDDHGRIAVAAGGGDTLQRLAQCGGVVLHRRHPVLGEEIGEEIHHRLPVLEHVGDARRRAAIILQHVELVGGNPHDVDADDVGIDAAGRRHPHHFRHEGFVLDDELMRDLAGAQDVLAVVEIVDEGVQRPHPLLDARRQLAPFGSGKDAGDDVEGDEPLGRLVVAIDGKGDALAAEDRLRLAQRPVHVAPRQGFQPIGDTGIGLPRSAAAAIHFVENRRHSLPLLRRSMMTWAGTAQEKHAAEIVPA